MRIRIRVLTSSKNWPLLNESPHQCWRLCMRHVTHVHESLDTRQGYTSSHRLSHSHTRPPTSPPTSPHNNTSVSHPFSLSFPPLCPLLSLSPQSLSHMSNAGQLQCIMHIHESFQMYVYVTSQIRMSHPTHMNEACHTAYMHIWRVVSHIWRRVSPVHCWHWRCSQFVQSPSRVRPWGVVQLTTENAMRTREGSTKGLDATE